MRRFAIAGLVGLILVVMLALAASTAEAQVKPTATPTLTPTATAVHAWQGYLLIEFNPAEPTLSRGVDVELEKRIREAFAQLAPERSSWPPYALQIGPCNIARTACIIEARFDRMPTLDSVADRLGSRLGTDRRTMSESIRLTPFAPGGTWQESQAECLKYLEENAKEWQPPMEMDPGTIEEPRTEEPPAAPVEGQVEG